MPGVRGARVRPRTLLGVQTVELGGFLLELGLFALVELDGFLGAFAERARGDPREVVGLLVHDPTLIAVERLGLLRAFTRLHLLDELLRELLKLRVPDRVFLWATIPEASGVTVTAWAAVASFGARSTISVTAAGGASVAVAPRRASISISISRTRCSSSAVRIDLSGVDSQFSSFEEILRALDEHAADPLDVVVAAGRSTGRRAGQQHDVHRSERGSNLDVGLERETFEDLLHFGLDLLDGLSGLRILLGHVDANGGSARREMRTVVVELEIVLGGTEGGGRLV